MSRRRVFFTDKSFLHCTIKKSLYDKLKEESKKTGEKMSVVIRRIVEDFYNNNAEIKEF